MTIAWTVALAFLAVQLVVLAVNAVSFPHLRPATVDRKRLARASVLVPARDEAHNLPRTLPALLAQGAGEVLVLDDGSSDGTAAILAGMAARHPELRVVAGRPLPAGWSGRTGRARSSPCRRAARSWSSPTPTWVGDPARSGRS